MPLAKELRDKIGLFCNIPGEAVIQNLDAETLYEVPLMLEEEGLAEIVCKRLKLVCGAPDLTEWTEIVNRVKNLKHKVKIALVGKYVALHDAYMSIVESLKHGGIANDADVEIKWINSEEVTEENTKELLSDVDGILVPGGFGDRGIEGKIEAIRYARENNIPFFGICLGMQLAVVEYARNVVGLKDAHSSELNPATPYPVIDLMPEQKDIEEMGGTMRLGLYPCKINESSKTYEAYKDELVYERHRHRYEVNNEYREQIKDAGMVISGLSPDERLVEIVELADHSWFVGVQFHPEFKSRPNRPHPLFREFVAASLGKR
jgi:CTP synthase